MLLTKYLIVKIYKNFGNSDLKIPQYMQFLQRWWYYLSFNKPSFYFLCIYSFENFKNMDTVNDNNKGELLLKSYDVCGFSFQIYTIFLLS